MTRGFSIYLDAVRVFAALVVLASHVGYEWASGGSLLWIRELNLGSDFVIVFFVLSGVVIAHTTRVKDKSLGSYAAARLSRLYSVAIPAILLSYAALVIIASYPGASIAAPDIASEVFAALTFTNYAWFGETRLPTNGPYWSVAYEFWYYALFGAWTFLQGRARLFSLVAIVLIVGVQVLLLFPCWLLGVYVYRRVISSEKLPMARSAVWVRVLAPLAIYAGCLALKVPFFLKVLTFAALGNISPWTVLHFSDEFVWNTIIAGLVAVHFMGVAQLIAGHQPTDLFVRTVRWLSGRTFSLYLFHMPLLKIFANHPAYDPTNSVHVLVCVICVFALCILFAELTECRLGWWRAKSARLRNVMESHFERDGAINWLRRPRSRPS